LLGTWSIAEGGAIQVDLTVAESKQQILFQLDEGELTSTGPKGTKNKLVKL
jgi:hypothetical protein